MPRIIALVVFRDERHYLPGLLRNISPQVDGIVGLDDGSSDGSGDIVAGCPLTRDIIRLDRGPGSHHDDHLLHSTVIRAAWHVDADWLLGIDADERLSHGFRREANAVIASLPDADAFWAPLREVWSRSDYRGDGLWGAKRVARLFRSSADHVFDRRTLHGQWASIHRPPETWPSMKSPIYHLRMMRAEDRQRRRDKYTLLDPDREHQAIGYDYMLDEADLITTRIPWRDRRRLHPPRRNGGA